MSTRRLFFTLSAVILLALAAARPLMADDAASSFSKTANPVGPWAYGYTPTRGGAFAFFAGHGTDGTGLDYWTAGAGLAQVAHNGTGSGKTAGSVYTPPGGLNLTPGSDYNWAVVRWTAPAAGSYEVNAHFIPRTLASSASGTAEVAILQSGAVLFDRWLATQLGMGTVSVVATLTLSAGATVDFAVGTGDDVYNDNDVIGLDATVDAIQPPSAAGPVFSFGAQRFVAAQWGSQVFESIAFDPVNRRLASRGFIRYLCGNQVSTGPDEQPGLTWDSKTGTYWQITGDRVVRRWSAAGALLDTVFTIPLTFSVPSSGPDTLESVRGIATDSTNVYVIDAGPTPGALASNEWFKFTRTGSPVKSSKSTNFVSSLGPGTEATVDDICYVPFASPVLPGMLVVALEHTGLQVIDTNGNFVSAFRWAEQGLATRPIAALAGVAVDPANGNFYLGDNDRDVAMVLTRIAPQGAASYLVGGDGASGPALTAVLKYPTPGCDLPLWNTWGIPPTIPSNFFGLAYRTVDNSVYMCEFNTGDMWRFDPRMGNIQRVGPTGVGGWGLAYDSDRDLLYGMVGSTPCHVVTIDPASGAVASLPNPVGYSVSSSADIAWDSADKKIYVVDFSTLPNHLLRIDRDTGIGAAVGNISGVRGGLEFDASVGKLITIGSSANQLIAIDPATASTSVYGSLPAANGFEGLAVVPVPANSGLLAVHDPPPARFDELAALPNPSRGAATLAFALPTPQTVTIGVYDVTGRRVRALASSRLMVGAQHVTWDGHDDDGRVAPSGVYFARVESPSLTRVARIVLTR